MSSPKVSIVLVTHNRPSYLQEAIESVASQTFEDWELLIFDNGSDDKTAMLVKSFVKEDNRIRYFFQDNIGISAARARAISYVSGDYVAFLDDDDLYYPKKIESQVCFLDKNPKIGMVYSYVDMVDENKKFIRTWPDNPVKNFEGLVADCVIQPNSVLVRKKCFDTVGTFRIDLKGSDDYEMWLRISRFFTMDFLPEIVGQYRRHGMSTSSNLDARYLNAIQIYKMLLAEPLPRPIKRIASRNHAKFNYFRASSALDASDWGIAFKYFCKAVVSDVNVGFSIRWSKSEVFIYRFLKPYLAIFYTGIMAFWSRLVGCLAEAGATSEAEDHIR
ncbi:MAG: glycosyltransferase [Candidatus Omnitrophica bacterium]|nr:glycosyltransferase [Candidatus Omnitrophota bacterium]